MDSLLAVKLLSRVDSFQAKLFKIVNTFIAKFYARVDSFTAVKLLSRVDSFQEKLFKRVNAIMAKLYARVNSFSAVKLLAKGALLPSIYTVPVLRTRILQSQAEEILRSDHQEIHELLHTVSQSCNPYISVPLFNTTSVYLQPWSFSLLSYCCRRRCGHSSAGRNTGTTSTLLSCQDVPARTQLSRCKRELRCKDVPVSINSAVKM